LFPFLLYALFHCSSLANSALTLFEEASSIYFAVHIWHM
jgi:hypothetical protein